MYESYELACSQWILKDTSFQNYVPSCMKFVGGENDTNNSQREQYKEPFCQSENLSTKAIKEMDRNWIELK